MLILSLYAYRSSIVNSDLGAPFVD